MHVRGFQIRFKEEDEISVIRGYDGVSIHTRNGTVELSRSEVQCFTKTPTALDMGFAPNTVCFGGTREQITELAKAVGLNV